MSNEERADKAFAIRNAALAEAGVVVKLDPDRPGSVLVRLPSGTGSDIDPRVVWKAHNLALAAVGGKQYSDPTALGRKYYRDMVDELGADHKRTRRFVAWWNSWGYPVDKEPAR